MKDLELKKQVKEKFLRCCKNDHHVIMQEFEKIDVDSKAFKTLKANWNNTTNHLWYVYNLYQLYTSKDKEHYFHNLEGIIENCIILFTA